jgi:hypothetical protein
MLYQPLPVCHAVQVRVLDLHASALLNCPDHLSALLFLCTRLPLCCAGSRSSPLALAAAVWLQEPDVGFTCIST